MAAHVLIQVALIPFLLLLLLLFLLLLLVLLLPLLLSSEWLSCRALIAMADIIMRSSALWL